MPFFMQCHFCQNKFDLPYTAVETTCPNCQQRLRVDHLDKAFTWEASSPAAVSETELFQPAPQTVPAYAPPPVLEKAPVKPVPRTVPVSMPAAAEIAPVKAIPRTVPASALPTLQTSHGKPPAKNFPAAGLPRPLPGDFEEDGSPADWVNPLGLAAFCFAVLALLLASVVAMRILTITLSAMGIVVVVLGFWLSRNDRQIKDWIWLALGGTISGGVLLLALWSPQVINSRWAIDFAVTPSDPNQQVLIPRDYPRDEGRPVSAEEWVDAATEAIRQNDLFIRVDSVEADRLPDKGDTRYLLVHLRLSNSGQGRTIALAGFSRDQHVPVLRDDSGHAYPFLEQRRGRKIIKGPVVYEVPDAKTLRVPPSRLVDYLLVFAAPPDKVGALNLEVPASAWDRTGVCKFRCPGYFKANVHVLKGKP
jgi:hypothetical protein